MKSAAAGLLAMFVAGCTGGIDDAMIEADFHESIAAQHPDVRVAKVTGVQVSDGWDDGLEAYVLFEGDCNPGKRCPSGTGLELAYRRDDSGTWRVFHSELVATENR